MPDVKGSEEVTKNVALSVTLPVTLVKGLDWAPRLHDLNPIEDLWGNFLKFLEHCIIKLMNSFWYNNTLCNKYGRYFCKVGLCNALFDFWCLAYFDKKHWP